MYCNGSTLTCAVLMSARIFLENSLTERERKVRKWNVI